MDIPSFEHAAKSYGDMEAVEQAKAQLRVPLALFKLPADCQVAKARVEVVIGERDHG